MIENYLKAFVFPLQYIKRIGQVSKKLYPSTKKGREEKSMASFSDSQLSALDCHKTAFYRSAFHCLSVSRSLYFTHSHTHSNTLKHTHTHVPAYLFPSSQLSHSAPHTQAGNMNEQRKLSVRKTGNPSYSIAFSCTCKTTTTHTDTQGN